MSHRVWVKEKLLTALLEHKKGPIKGKDGKENECRFHSPWDSFSQPPSEKNTLGELKKYSENSREKRQKDKDEINSLRCGFSKQQRAGRAKFTFPPKDKTRPPALELYTYLMDIERASKRRRKQGVHLANPQLSKSLRNNEEQLKKIFHH